MSAAETVPANQPQPATPPAVNAASRAGASVQGSPTDAPAVPALDPRFLRGDRGSRNKSLARLDAWAEKLESHSYVGTSAPGHRLPVSFDPPPGAVVTEHTNVEYQNGVRVEYTSLSWTCE